MAFNSIFRELRDDLQQIVKNRMPGPNPPIVVLCADWFLHDVETDTLVCRDAKPSTVAKMKRALGPKIPFQDRVERLVLVASSWPRLVEQALTELRDEKLAERNSGVKKSTRNMRERQKRRTETMAQKLARQQARRVQDANRAARRAAAAAAAASPEV